jgi:hypothetical protein
VRNRSFAGKRRLPDGRLGLGPMSESHLLIDAEARSTDAIAMRRKRKFRSTLSMIIAVQTVAQKYSYFSLSEFMLSSRHPVLMQRGVRVVTIRRGGERWPRACQVLLRWTIGSSWTVKPCGPGAPMLAPSLLRHDVSRG